MRKLLSCVLFLVVVLQLSLVRAAGYSASQIVVPLLTKPVTIDGRWTSADEWSDALKIALINCGCSSVAASGYLYAKHDPSNFYFLIDFTSSTVLDANNDGASVMIDPLHNDGTPPQTDDREFITFPIAPGSAMRVGTGVQGNAWSLKPVPDGVKMAYSMASSVNQAQPHEIAEFLVPHSIFPAMQNTIGFTVTAAHGASASSQFSVALWPANFARENVATWGELTISPTPIPEFPYGWLTMGVTLLVCLTLTWSRRRSSPGPV